MSITAHATAGVRPAAPPRPAPGTGRPRPRLRVVGRPRRTARVVLAVVLVAVVGVIGVVSLSALAAEAAFEARSLQGEVEDLSLRYDELTAEVAALEAPARIRAVARDDLGMVRADSPTFLVAEGPTRVGGALTDRIKPVLGQ